MKISELKREARVAVKRSYWAYVAVCFLCAFSGSSYSVTTYLIRQYNASPRAPQMLPGFRVTHADSLWQMVETISRNSVSRANGGDIGVVNGAINFVTQASGLFIRAAQVVVSFITQDSLLGSIMLLCSFALGMAYLLAFAHPLSVGLARYALEARSYTGTKISRVLWAFRSGKLRHIIWVMLLRSLKLLGWWFIPAMGPIKTYEYRMLPYILAENPSVSAKQAFALSRRMMRGCKWRAFLLDLSYAGWFVLSLLTGGLVGFFYLNPYHAAANAQLYARLRERVLLEHPSANEKLDNVLLMPSHREEYPLNPFRFVTNETGVFRRAFSSLPNSLRKYSFTGIIMLFFTFSIFGWVWEVLLELVTNGILVNRGTMHGPWLPIYGVGGVLVLLMLRPWRKHPVVTFALACAVCGTLEYIASWLLEQMHGTKWWDYSGYFLNLNGRICLEGVLVFGIGSVAFIYFLAPWFDELYKKHISQNIRIILCTLLAALFIIDFAYSNKNPNTGEGITDYGMQPAAAQSVSDAPAFAPTE